ncbi:hypothetical protein FQZ97_996410 [compost metagenome]
MLLQDELGRLCFWIRPPQAIAATGGKQITHTPITNRLPEHNQRRNVGQAYDRQGGYVTMEIGRAPQVGLKRVLDTIRDIGPVRSVPPSGAWRRQHFSDWLCDGE